MEESAELSPVSSEDVTRRWKAPRLTALIFADFINQTADNKFNLLGIFDRLYVDPKVQAARPFGLFVRTASTFEGKLEVICYAPTGAVAISIKADIQGSGNPEQLSHLQIGVMVELQAKVEGVYWFGVSLNGKELGGAGLLVEYRTSEGEEQDGANRHIDNPSDSSGIADTGDAPSSGIPEDGS